MEASRVAAGTHAEVAGVFHEKLQTENSVVEPWSDLAMMSIRLPSCRASLIELATCDILKHNLRGCTRS